MAETEDVTEEDAVAAYLQSVLPVSERAGQPSNEVKKKNDLVLNILSSHYMSEEIASKDGFLAAMSVLPGVTKTPSREKVRPHGLPTAVHRQPLGRSQPRQSPRAIDICLFLICDR